MNLSFKLIFTIEVNVFVENLSKLKSTVPGIVLFMFIVLENT